MYRLTDEELAEIGVDTVEAIQTVMEGFREFVENQKDDVIAKLARQYHLDEDTVRKLEYG